MNTAIDYNMDIATMVYKLILNPHGMTIASELLQHMKMIEKFKELK